MNTLFSMNEKWSNSSVVTKVPMFAMALDALLLLVCSILFFIFAGMGVDSAGGLGVIWLFAFLINTVLAFGLFKVNRIARIVTIYTGLCLLLPYVLLAILFVFSLIRIPVLGTLLQAYWSLVKNVIPMVMSFVPGDAKALAGFLMVVFVGPFVLNILAMLILLFCGKDYKYGGQKKKSKLVAYLLWLFLGFFSAHKFYLDKDGVGIAYFFTFQILWFGWFINLFTLGKQVDAYNAKLVQTGVLTD